MLTDLISSIHPYYNETNSSVEYKTLWNNCLVFCLTDPHVKISCERLAHENHFLTAYAKMLELKWSGTCGVKTFDLEWQSSFKINNALKNIYTQKKNTVKAFLNLWKQFHKIYEENIKLLMEKRQQEIELLYQTKFLLINQKKREILAKKTTSSVLDLAHLEIKQEHIKREIEKIQHRIYNIMIQLKEKNLYTENEKAPIVDIEFVASKDVLENIFEGMGENIDIHPSDLEDILDYFDKDSLVDLNIEYTLSKKKELSSIGHSVEVVFSILPLYIWQSFSKDEKIKLQFLKQSEERRKAFIQKSHYVSNTLNSLNFYIEKTKKELQDLEKIPAGIIDYNSTFSKIEFLLSLMQQKDKLLLDIEISKIFFYSTRNTLIFLSKTVLN